MSPGAFAVFFAAWVGQVQPGVRAGGDAVADVLTLRDGAAVRGEVVELSPKAGTVTVIKRRDWARKHRPAGWNAGKRPERPAGKSASTSAASGLTAWRRGARRRRRGRGGRPGPRLDRSRADPPSGGARPRRSGLAPDGRTPLPSGDVRRLWPMDSRRSDAVVATLAWAAKPRSNRRI